MVVALIYGNYSDGHGFCNKFFAFLRETSSQAADRAGLRELMTAASHPLRSKGSHFSFGNVRRRL
jgi:hypothetical protein